MANTTAAPTDSNPKAFARLMLSMRGEKYARGRKMMKWRKPVRVDLEGSIGVVLICGGHSRTGPCSNRRMDSQEDRARINITEYCVS
jgi:hypothetical protein